MKMFSSVEKKIIYVQIDSHIYHRASRVTGIIHNLTWHFHPIRSIYYWM